MMRWLQIHLSTLLLVMLLAGALLGMNRTRRARLEPLGLTIGRGDSSIPIEAFASYAYRGWPCVWEEQGEFVREGAIWDAGVAVLSLAGATMGCEFFVRRRVRSAPSSRPSAARRGFVALTVLAFVATMLAWHNLVLAPAGPFAARGWPLHYQAFFRVEAVVSPQDLAEWDDVSRRRGERIAINLAVAGTLLAASGLAVGIATRRRSLADR